MEEQALQIVIKAIDEASAQLKTIAGSLGNLEQQGHEMAAGIHQSSEETNSAFSSMTSTIQNFARLQFAQQIAGQFISLAKQGVEFAVGYASNLEQARIAYDAFTGSAKLGGKALEEVTNFARTTPFQLPEV